MVLAHFSRYLAQLLRWKSDVQFQSYNFTLNLSSIFISISFGDQKVIEANDDDDDDDDDDDEEDDDDDDDDGDDDDDDEEEDDDDDGDGIG